MPEFALAVEGLEKRYRTKLPQANDGLTLKVAGTGHRNTGQIQSKSWQPGASLFIDGWCLMNSQIAVPLAARISWPRQIWLVGRWLAQWQFCPVGVRGQAGQAGLRQCRLGAGRLHCHRTRPPDRSLHRGWTGGAITDGPRHCLGPSQRA